MCEQTLQAKVLVGKPDDLNLIPQDPHVCPLTATCVCHITCPMHIRKKKYM